jgi:hypothetical protein
MLAVVVAMYRLTTLTARESNVGSGVRELRSRSKDVLYHRDCKSIRPDFLLHEFREQWRSLRHISMFPAVVIMHAW